MSLEDQVHMVEDSLDCGLSSENDPGASHNEKNLGYYKLALWGSQSPLSSKDADLLLPPEN